MHNTMLAVSMSVILSTSLQEPKAESCPHRGGWQPAPDELRSILQKHELWVREWGQARQPLAVFSAEHPQGRAVLCNTELSGIVLRGAMLPGADLRTANLYGADLERANLSQADLSGAHLAGVNLNGAHLEGAKLDRAFLTPARDPIVRDGVPAPNPAKLNGAFLTGASLSEAVLAWAELNRALLLGTRLEKADLRWASLREARLDGADLSEARLAGTDLTRALYAPLPSSPNPELDGITGIETLQTSAGKPLGLVRLRELLRKAELRELEREATFAIESNRTRDLIEVARMRTPATVAEGLFRRVAYDLTTAYGLHPSRALVVILVGAALLVPVYWLALLRARAKGAGGGIYRVWPKDRIDAGKEEPRADSAARAELLKPGPLRAVAWAAYFSLLSACHIGFREFNVGKWISSVQRHEYELQATGWPRTVSGLQSLVSLYLLAIWVLTYFGRPFG